METDDRLHEGNTLFVIREYDLDKLAEKIASKFKSNTEAITVESRKEKPLTQKQAAEFLGRSRQTLITWRKKGIIKGKRLGGRIYFFESELLDAMQR